MKPQREAGSKDKEMPCRLLRNHHLYSRLYDCFPKRVFKLCLWPVTGDGSHTHIEIVWLRPYWNLVRAGDAPVVTSEARSAVCFRNICFPANFIAVKRWEVAAVGPCLPASIHAGTA